jgi:hypothetical protein
MLMYSIVLIVMMLAKHSASGKIMFRPAADKTQEAET